MTNHDGVTGTPVQAHIRLNDSFITNQERKVLHWLAPRMPDWVTPDTLTAFGLFGSVVIFAGYALTSLNPAYLWLATLGFVINWFGDSLDGTLARYRHIERPVYGFYIDHVVDSICQVLFFLGLGVSPYISFNVAMVALVGYQLMGLLVYTLTYVVGEYKISYGKLGPTEVRVVAILATTCMFFFGMVTVSFNLPWVGAVTVGVYDLLVGAVAFLLFGFFINSAWQKGRELRKLGE
jgi:archaetidylinositol phosphate synthase